MKVIMHMPRKSEAKLTPEQKTDLTVEPKFYRKTGWHPIAFFTTVDSYQEEEKYALVISAATKQLRLEKLVEVVPNCDVRRELRNPESTEEAPKE